MIRALVFTFITCYRATFQHPRWVLLTLPCFCPICTPPNMQDKDIYLSIFYLSYITLLINVYSYMTLLVGILTCHVWFDWTYSCDDRSTSSTSSVLKSRTVVQRIYLLKIDFTKPISSKKLKYES